MKFNHKKNKQIIKRILYQNKKLITICAAFFLCLLLILNHFFNTDFQTESNKGTGSINDPILITDVNDLIQFRNRVNSGETFQGLYIKQTADIDLSNIPEWIPIGIYGSSNYFYGTYDGCGYSIKNLSSTQEKYPGFFGKLGGIVKNLEIIDCNLSGNHVGGIASHSTGSPQIINCSVTGNLQAVYRAGGISDNFAGGTIINCYSNCTITAKIQASIAAYNASSIINCIGANDELITETFDGSLSNSYILKDLNSSIEYLNNYVQSQTSDELTIYGQNDFNLWEISNDQLTLGQQTYASNAVIPYIILAICFVIAFIFIGKYLYKIIKDPYTLIFSILSILGLISTLYILFATHGEFWTKFFFKDSLDSGMDFFHSIEYTKGRKPYELFNTLYPPLANLLFYCLFRLVPAWEYNKWASTFSDGISYRGTSADLRVWQPTFLIFLCFILAFVFLFTYACKKILANNKHSSLICFLSLFSFGILYALERGNIIILCLILTLFFLLYYNSENKVLKEFSYICLAISAGLKIYPAVYGIILIYERKYKEALRCVLYGLFFFLAPFLAFKEKFSGLPIFLSVLFSFGDTSSQTGLSTNGSAIFNAFNNLITVIANETGLTLNDAFIANLTSILGLLIVLIILFCGFFLKKNWQRSLVCTLALIGYQSQGLYIFSFMLIPLLFFIQEEKTSTKTNRNIFILLCISTIVLPISRENRLYYFRFQICLMLLAYFLIKLAIQNIKKGGYLHDRKHGNRKIKRET